jgi:hypothetical protein
MRRIRGLIKCPVVCCQPLVISDFESILGNGGSKDRNNSTVGIGKSSTILDCASLVRSWRPVNRTGDFQPVLGRDYS